MAVQNGDQEIVKLLIDYNADINSPNYRRVTPLAAACKRQDWEMVNLLLDKKARGLKHVCSKEHRYIKYICALGLRQSLQYRQ